MCFHLCWAANSHSHFVTKNEVVAFVSKLVALLSGSSSASLIDLFFYVFTNWKSIRFQINYFMLLVIVLAHLNQIIKAYFQNTFFIFHLLGSPPERISRNLLSSSGSENVGENLMTRNFRTQCVAWPGGSAAKWLLGQQYCWNMRRADSMDTSPQINMMIQMLLCLRFFDNITEVYLSSNLVRIYLSTNNL